MSSDKMKDFMDPKERLSRLAEQKKYLDSNPESGVAMQGYLDTLNKLGRHQEVVDFCLHGRAQIPTFWMIPQILAESLIALNRYDEAIKLLNEDIDRIGDDCAKAFTADNYQLLAKALTATGRHDEALQALQRFQQMDLELTMINIKNVRAEIKGCPNDPEVHFELAASLAHIHDFSGAIKAIRKAIKLSPSEAEYQERLAQYEKEVLNSKH